MELHQIKSFVTVARTGNLTRAAQELNTTPPSVSTHIRQLEEEFNLILFSRTSKGMVLTDQGKGLVERATQILKAAGLFSQAAQETSGRIRGNLKFGINADPDFLRIGPIVHYIFHHHPDLCLEVVPSNTPGILDRISRGKLDMGYVFGSHEKPGIEFRELARVDLKIVVPLRFESSHKRAGWEEISTLPWIHPTSLCPFLDQVKAILSARDLVLTHLVTANDDITKSALINQGRAATVLEVSEAKSLEETGKVFLWDGGTPLFTRVCLAYLKSRSNQPDIKTLALAVEKSWGPD